MKDTSHTRPKLEDVARLAGVSKTTVSRVLNNRGYLSEKTIQKVNDAMAALGYQPNIIARQLFQQKTYLVGLIFPTVNNPFFAQLEAEMERLLYKRGYKVLMGNSQNDPDKEEDYLKQLLTHQVDGLIVGAHNQGLKEYSHHNLPIVSIDRIMNDDIPVVSSDNFQGGKLATEKLLKRGCRYVVHTNGPLNLNTPAQQRRLAYESVMEAHGLKPITYHIDFNISQEEKREVLRCIFEEHPLVDGIFASNDTDAAILLSLAREYHREVPRDLKIIGYDGADMTQLLLPHLSTIQQPINQMAKTAVNLLENRMNGKVSKSNTHILPVKLLDNGTC